MISCDSFRARFEGGTEDAALLEHLRSCDRCLDVAAHADPDVMFRALGGSEMIPPGGIDAFVDGVMQQVRVRDAETAVAAAKVVSWPRRMALAAAIGVAVFGATLAYRVDAPQASSPAARVAAAVTVPKNRILTTKPIVETYDSQNATIVEVPTEATGDDVKIVMIFDENFPADL
ncbi:MAG TPA: hypothetical protein VF883_18950 [Thermoanaerobaculia bacterium]|jgi:hypothetical protein